MAAGHPDYPRDLIGYGRTIARSQMAGRRAGGRADRAQSGGWQRAELLFMATTGQRGLLTDTGFPPVPNARSVLVEFRLRVRLAPRRVAPAASVRGTGIRSAPSAACQRLKRTRRSRRP